jgi:hypothetical protein
MAETTNVAPDWLCYADLACAIVAGASWYLLPGIGPWPLIVALVPWAIRFVVTGQPTERTPFDVPLLLFLFTAAVAVWAAYLPAAAWPKFWRITGGVILFYAFVNAWPVASVRVWLLALLGAGVAAYFLLMHDWDAYPAKIELVSRIGRALQAPLPVLPGHRLHPNVAGGLMAMLVPFCGLAATRSWRAIRRSSGRTKARDWVALLAAASTLALTLFGLVLTTSRAAWIALGIALLLAVLWAVAGWVSQARGLARAWVFPGLVVLVLAIGTVVGLAWPGSIIAASQALPGANTTISRIELLRNAPVLVQDYPIIGAGLGGFQMLYSSYVLLSHVGYSIHSHNLFLDVSVEQGLLALLALSWMWILFALAVWRGLLHSHRRRGSDALGAAALSLVVVLIHGLVDDVLYGSRGVLLLFVPLAFAVPFLSKPSGRAGRWTSWVLPIGLVLVAAVAILLRGPVLSLLSSNLASVHQSQAELSLYAWPQWPIQDEVRRQVDLSRVVAEYERALAFNPNNASANRRLGMIELSLGEYEEALAHLEAAYATQPGNRTTRQLYGEALIANGRLNEGKALWTDVYDEQGQLDARIFWYQHIGDQERAEWMKQAAGGE